MSPKREPKKEELLTFIRSHSRRAAWTCYNNTHSYDGVNANQMLLLIVLTILDKRMKRMNIARPCIHSKWYMNDHIMLTYWTWGSPEMQQIWWICRQMEADYCRKREFRQSRSTPWLPPRILKIWAMTCDIINWYYLCDLVYYTTCV